MLPDCRLAILSYPTQEIDVADANGDISPTAPVEIGQFNLQLVSERTDAADTRLTGSSS